MKHKLKAITMIVFLLLMLGPLKKTSLQVITPIQEKESEGRTPPDVLKLAADAKLGSVVFSHTNHTTMNYNIAGTGPVTCIECHHTAQPASEVAKHPPLKTAWPADRTTTLTAEEIKDPKSPTVAACRGCHARPETKPKLLPAIPEIKDEGSTAMITVTNQQAFHRNCAGCHEQAAKERSIKAPKRLQCTVCHKKAAA
jgi:cytochrome c553